ncbi:unnamed protein product, partial [Effrenium voratum]
APNRAGTTLTLPLRLPTQAMLLPQLHLPRTRGQQLLLLVCRRNRIFCTMKPLADEYLAILDAVRAQDTNRQLQAGWANRAWASVVANCLSTLGDEITLQRLGLLSPYLDVEHDEEDGLKLKQMIVSVASQRCWSMAVHSELCPDQWLGLLDTNPKASQLAHAQMQSDFRIVEKATQLSSMAPDLRTRE